MRFPRATRPSGLVYKNQSGALNESFADIFGIVIKNWYLASDRENVDTWNWELGTGLGARGLPLRDLSNPSRTGDPQHMNEFVHTTADDGGVHTNSNIHNKAAYHLLTLASRDNTRVFSVQDVAVLLYLGMARLAPLADFSDALQAVVHVAETFYGGAADRKEKVAAVRQAYGLVGIQYVTKWLMEIIDSMGLEVVKARASRPSRPGGQRCAVPASHQAGTGLLTLPT